MLCWYARRERAREREGKREMPDGWSIIQFGTFGFFFIFYFFFVCFLLLIRRRRFDVTRLNGNVAIGDESHMEIFLDLRISFQPVFFSLLLSLSHVVWLFGFLGCSHRKTISRICSTNDLTLSYHVGSFANNDKYFQMPWPQTINNDIALAINKIISNERHNKWLWPCVAVIRFELMRDFKMVLPSFE